MDCLSNCGRIIIVILNFIISLLGFVILVLGIMVKVGSDQINSLLDTALQSLQEQLNTSGFGTIDMSQFNISQLVGGLGTGFIVLGVILLVIGVSGLIGACCKIKLLLVVYLILIIVLFLGQVIVVILLFAARQVFDDAAKPKFKEMIKNEYQGFNGTDVTSLAWNVLMRERACCGVDDYNDFATATMWVRDYTTQSPINGILQAPIACCINVPSSAPDFSCAKAPSDAESNWKKGCYDSLWSYVVNESGIVIGVVCAILGLQILLIFFTIWILYQINKEAKVSMA
ncbi:tetraspanin-18-like [Gigantopelta aegis]|uniref:tetraspanin-18-like n=1 Tax=Gigantopelta aegis TaxID=1735272 RepID=UPI001B88CC50|nr:tetraspanin-18-like [Gigantopelta aegis]